MRRKAGRRPPARARAPAVRIGAGRWKGRLLEVPQGARPTSGKAREALFDILQKRVAGARVLELYAGSGAVGLEALSRGAARSVLVEPSARALGRNLGRLAPETGTVEVLRCEASAAISDLLRRDERFDIVFADPPYASELEADVFAGVARLLAEGGTFVLQSDAGREPMPAGLRLTDRRAYGRNVLRFFEAERVTPAPSRPGRF